MDERYLDFGGGAPRTTTPRPMRTPTHTRETLVGKLVLHNELGRGVVIEEHDNILTIAFNKIGIKKVAREFVQIANN